MLVFTPNDLAHAFFTTGRTPGDQVRFGDASYWEFLHRTSLIPAYVRIGSKERLVRSALALKLDRSEKGAVSYALGQAVTGIFCEKLLGVSHLLHVDRYQSQYGVSFGRTRRRPDLFGWSPAGWVVAEAKGRSNAMGSDLRDRLEVQKRAIRTIGGRRPYLALGCVASFSAKTGPLRVDAFDPEGEVPEAVDLGITADEFFLAYYEPFVRAITRSDRTERTQRMTVAVIDGAGIRVGLDSRILRRVRNASEGDVEGLRGDVLDLVVPEPGLDDEDEIGQVFPDGTLVSTSWDDVIRDGGLAR